MITRTAIESTALGVDILCRFWNEQSVQSHVENFIFVFVLLIASRRQVFTKCDSMLFPWRRQTTFLVFMSTCSMHYARVFLRSSALLYFLSHCFCTYTKNREKINTKVCYEVCCKSKYTSPSSSPSLSYAPRHPPKCVSYPLPANCIYSLLLSSSVCIFISASVRSIFSRARSNNTHKHTHARAS